MKNFSITFLFSIITVLSFTQNKPQFIIEQSASGYDIILSLENFSKLSSIKIEGHLKKNNFSEALHIDLNINDVKHKKAFTSFENDAIQAAFIIVITDDNGKETRYPTIDLNILKES